MWKYKNTEIKDINSVPDGALIHEGFQYAAVGLWKELANPLLSKIQEEGIESIIFTGHSLGAATALLTCVHYSTAMPSSSSSPAIITFGRALCSGIFAIISKLGKDAKLRIF